MLPCLVTFYLLLELPHSLGEQPALNVAFMLGFKEFEASDVFKEQLYRKKFCLDFLTYHLPGQLLSCRRSAGGT